MERMSQIASKLLQRSKNTPCVLFLISLRMDILSYYGMWGTKAIIYIGGDGRMGEWTVNDKTSEKKAKKI